MRLERPWRALLTFAIGIGALAAAYVHDERATDRELAPYRAIAEMRSQGEARVEIPASLASATSTLSLRFIDEPATPAAREAAASVGAELDKLARGLDRNAGARRLTVRSAAFFNVRIAAALAIRAQQLVEQGRKKEAAESLLAILVLAKAAREQGTAAGLTVGTELGVRGLKLILRLHESVDARALAAIADLAWPSTVDALEGTRRARAEAFTTWALEGEPGSFLPGLVRKNAALHGLERLDERLAVLASAASSGADACAALDKIASSVVDPWTALHEEEFLCRRLETMRDLDTQMAQVRTALR